MVRPVGLLDDLEAQVAVAPPALVAEPLERRDGVVLARRDDVDVRRDVDDVAHGGRVDGADREPGVHAFVGRGVADRRDLFPCLHRARALAVRLERLLIFPDLEDRELVGLVDALDHLTAQIAALFAGRLAVAPEQRYAVRLRRRHDLDVGHRVNVALDRRGRRGLPSRGADRADRHHDQAEDENPKERCHGVTPFCMLPQAARAERRFRANSARSVSAFFLMTGWPNSAILPYTASSVPICRRVPPSPGASWKLMRARIPPPNRRSFASARMRARQTLRSRSTTVMVPCRTRRIGPI